MLITELAKKILRYNKNANLNLIEKAFKYLENSKNKDIIEHNFNTAEILTNLKLNSTIISASLLQSILTEKNEKEMESLFNKQIINLLKDLSNLNKLNLNNVEENSSDIKKILLAEIKDIKALFIQIASKLDYLRHYKKLSVEKRKEIAKKVIAIYAPLSYRIGIGAIKWELEDLSFKILHPKKFKEIKNKLNEKRESREIKIHKTKKIIEEVLKNQNIEAEINGRAKHIYSIYKKIKNREYKFEEMYDLVALRILTKSIEDCYKVLEIIHKLWKPIENRFKDYISNPKLNNYQSIHTAVLGIDNTPTEIQIRTKEMHLFCEEGTAAHWTYKGNITEEEFDKKLTLLKRSLEQDIISVDFFTENIYISTPKGKIIELPKGATVLDFAYAIHSDVGEKCIGAKINEKFENIKIKFSLCCNPIPGDKITGFNLGEKKISIHRTDCKTIKEKKPKKRLHVEWK